jgi:hypothetical protein
MARVRNPIRDHKAPDGRTVIVIGPYCWGKDAYVARALRKAQSQIPDYIRPENRKYHVFEVPDRAFVNGMGGISLPVYRAGIDGDSGEEVKELGIL